MPRTSLNTARPSNLVLALQDLKEGIGSIYIWPMLGWLEIRQRYRRSVLGPFWLTISTAALLGGMGPLYGRLFQQDVSNYFTYLGISYVMWLLISGIINDSCNAFIAAEGYIKQMKLPLSVHVLRVVWKNLIIFAHNLVIVVLILLIYRPAVNWTVLTLVAGVLFIALNGIWVGILLGLLCARFRDIPQLIASVVQVAFFLTPVMWNANMLGRNRWFAEINPLYHFLEIVRGPLTSGALNVQSWLVVFGVTIAGYCVTMVMFSRFRARIAYWV